MWEGEAFPGSQAQTTQAHLPHRQQTTLFPEVQEGNKSHNYILMPNLMDGTSITYISSALVSNFILGFLGLFPKTSQKYYGLTFSALKFFPQLVIEIVTKKFNFLRLL